MDDTQKAVAPVGPHKSPRTLVPYPFLVWGNTTDRASLHLPSYHSRYGLVRWVVVGRQGLRGSTERTHQLRYPGIQIAHGLG